MLRWTIRVTAAALATAACALAQSSSDPFPRPIASATEAIHVNVVEFASIPDVGGEPARMMLMAYQPGTRRYFVNDMRGPLYSVSEDGTGVRLYLDINDPRWGVRVQSRGSERGFQSFAFHPQFAQAGTPGFGRFYTYTDTSNMGPRPDFLPGGGNDTHDTVLLEWRANTPDAPTYDGGEPRELLRLRQPFGNHNGGLIAFNSTARPGTSDFGLLYVGIADGGSGGDPFEMAQDLRSAFGKLFRIDPLGRDSANGMYGIPRDNPFAAGGSQGVLREIYVYGVRNPQRFGWDPNSGRLFLADIGQNAVEEVSPVEAGANLGWNDWEGSFRFVGRSGVDLENQRGDPKVTYPVVEYDHDDPLLQGSVAVTGVVVYRSDTVPQLANLLLFGDNPSGEVFAVSADQLPSGGQDAIRRVLFGPGNGRTLLDLIRASNRARGRSPAGRADLRFGTGPDGRVFLLNKHDGTIRLIVR